MRHKLVQQIVKAYEAFSNGNGNVKPSPEAATPAVGAQRPGAGAGRRRDRA